MSLSYDLNPEEASPKPGEYLVSIGKRGINSIWEIGAVRKVQHKKMLDYQRYILEVVRTPGLKAFTEHDSETYQVWVRGEEAHPLFWYPRGKK